MPRPDPIRDRTRIPTDRRTIGHPSRDDRGADLSRHRRVERATRNTTIINTTINNTTIVNNIRHVHANPHRYQRNRHYWHHHGGVRYSFYWDSYGHHWWGFYWGSSYYWTRYWNDRFWWYDARRARWCYWHNGNWWWQDPVRIQYVYIYEDHNDSYYRYDQGQGGVIVRPEEPAPPAPGQPAPAPAPEEVTYYSDDGARMVQVYGERKEAFLYDVDDEDADPKFVAFLDDGVTEVRFSDTANGQALNILVLTEKKETREDGTEVVVKGFALFDANGQPLDPIQPAPPAEPGEGTEPAPAPEGSALEQLQGLGQ